LCEIGGCSRGDKEEGENRFGLERREEEVNPWQRDLDRARGRCWRRAEWAEPLSAGRSRRLVLDVDQREPVDVARCGLPGWPGRADEAPSEWK
jgi:hypothetical protein